MTNACPASSRAIKLCANRDKWHLMMTDNGRIENTLERILSGTIEYIDVFTQLVTVVRSANGR